MKYNGYWKNNDIKLIIFISGEEDTREFEFFDLEEKFIEKEKVNLSVANNNLSSYIFCSSSIRNNFHQCSSMKFNAENIEFYNNNKSFVFNKYIPEKLINL